ncbi:hypothetical protein BGZ83_008088 [Gryganskiella cystojenkinii]|nr:hypothetical protein BGZ83_008088 [Gryganskiella cystojenkinii]
MPHHGQRHPSLAYLHVEFDPPGVESAKGPRHDNDLVQIKDIRIVPTQAELTCERPPFLPSNDVPGAPHHLPPGWPRLLDIHFRLNREDMIDQLRQGIVLFLQALHKTIPGRRGDLFTRKRLRQLVGEDVSVNAYGNIELQGINISDQLRGSIRVSFDQPPQIKNQPEKKKRKIFWENSRRRLIKNSLVCFIYPAGGQDGVRVRDPINGELRLSLGIIHSKDIDEMARDAKKAVVHVTMIDNADYCHLVRAVKERVISSQDIFMVESLGGYFESYRHILRSLQMLEPVAMPFGKYLAPTEEQSTRGSATVITPPRYAMAPGFEFDLSVLLRTGRRGNLSLNVRDFASQQRAVAALRAYSITDDTQSQALVNSLCREVALISGPPGTGKTTIGVDLMRVLVHNAARMRCGPILCICYSDHALDQFLTHLLGKGIHSLVRIGSRPSERSEQLRHHNLYELVDQKTWTRSQKTARNKARSDCEKAAQSLKMADQELQSLQLSVASILQVVGKDSEEQHQSLKHGHCKGTVDHQLRTIEDNYLLWSSCDDLKLIQKENDSRKKKWKNDKSASSGRPILLPLPSTARSLNQLRQADLWTMSRWERKQLVEFWVNEVKREIQTRHTELMERMKDSSQAVEDVYDTVRQDILSNARVIGVTTYGAARHQALITALRPKIVICEEAGEVLESHILTALSESTQHLILIGDHLQLRPKISTYELSSESHPGQQYNLDRSLFERLINTAKVPSSLLTTQRRMRPEICDMVRHTLYPKLVDGGKVLEYPNVSGMASNLYFMSHCHPEDQRDQYLALSASNTFEAKMVEALVQHLLKNGYKQSSIAVLTPYINQLTKLRDTLQGTAELAFDERDQEQLNDMEDKKHITINFVNSQSSDDRLTLRTIDNYQGEEADIIIVSLVRSNTEKDEEGWSPTIGFLRSPNRTSVLLSRARHGMYLIGNASLMNQPKNGIWPKVMTELGINDRIGPGFLLRCRNHPDSEIPPATAPEIFKQFMPNGSCTMRCLMPLPCRHKCPRMCHFDDLEHLQSMCQEPCTRVLGLCGHTCSKKCREDCGNCQLFIGTVILPCGHKLENASCAQGRNRQMIQCKVRVNKRLPRCEYMAEMDCRDDASEFQCKVRVKKRLPHCVHMAEMDCRDNANDFHCKVQVKKYLPRCEHMAEMDCRDNANNFQCKAKCETTLECGHICPRNCLECQSTSTMACKSDPNTMKMVVDLFKKTPLGSVNVSEDPILVLSCGHVLSMSSLDDHMSIGDYYAGDTSGIAGTTTFVRAKPLPSSQVSMIGCPTCDSPIVGLKRYGRRIKYAQLTVRLKRFEKDQITSLSRAETMFNETLYLTQRALPAHLNSISSLVNTSAQEYVEKNLQAIWRIFSSSTSSSDPATSSKQHEDNPRRVRGSFTSDGYSLLNSDISSIFYVYDIPGEQGQIWLTLIEPVLRALKTFNEVHKQAVRSPIHELFQGADTTHLMEECARECGLPLDGKAGSSYVQSIQGQFNVLLLVLHAAMQVLEKISLKVYHDHPSASGWYKFVEDLLQCCVDHSHILCDAARKGKYLRLEINTKLNVLDLYLRHMQLLGYHPFDRSNALQKQKREDIINDVLTLFNGTLEDIIYRPNMDPWTDFVPKTKHYKAVQMESARKIALGEQRKSPSEVVELEIFRTKQTEFRRAGPWNRCPDGHSYVAANSKNTTQELACRDCGACIRG